MQPLDVNNPEFDRLVANALEHLWEYSYLGMHSLARLENVQHRLAHKSGVSHVDVGKVVSQVLILAIESLKPINGQAEFSREKNYYTVLTKAYLEGTENRTIAKSLNMGERTLYRYSIKAIQSVAQIIRDWESPNGTGGR